MALIVDPQSSFKHFCKICKKGFGCGSALGGHMRAHGIGDEAGQMDYEDQGSPTNKRMYALRTNPNRLKSCRVCENCGEKFLSWKSFLEHGKCNSEDAESLVSSPGSDDEDASGMRGCGWSKRKRLQRVNLGNFISNCPSSEEEDLANCLMMLSNGTVDSLVSEPEESCASASKDADRIRNNPINYPRAPPPKKAKGGVAGEGLFECKACKKVFNSHQALGGHRASHKKVKGCFAARLDEDRTTHEELSLNNKATSNFQFDHGSLNETHSKKKKSKVHECSICHRVFSTGQALGGHKRCHWITSNSPDPSNSMAMATKLHHFQDHLEQIQQRPKLLDLTLDLNLNLPAQTEMDAQADQEDNNNNNKDNNSKSPSTRINNVEDEADSIVKLAKLSDLKELNMKEGSSSPWLQVGIGSTTGVGADP